MEFLPPLLLPVFLCNPRHGTILPFGTVYDPVKEKHMNKSISLFAIALISMTLSSCEIVGGIFKAGVWTGLSLVALVLGLIIFLFTRGGRKD